jgi:hypothetical protein
MDGNYFIWLLLECIFAIINTVYLNIYVNKYYPWLRIGKFNKQLLIEHGPIIKNIKRLVSHKFASVSISQTDSILIFSFVGLSQVTNFTNYTLLNKHFIFNHANSVINREFDCK